MKAAKLERAELGLHSGGMGEPLKFSEWWNDCYILESSFDNIAGKKGGTDRRKVDPWEATKI